MVNKIDSTFNIKMLAVSVAVGVVLLCIKFSAYYITGSNAILGDALESIVNVAAGIISLLSVFIASIPKDKNHPYGHGKIEFLSAGFEGGFIAVSGILIIAKAIYNLFNPVELHNMQTGILLVVVSGVVNYIMGYVLVVNGRKNSSAATVASGKHLITDTYSTIGLLAGLLVIWLTGIVWLDNVVAIILGCFILHTGYKIVKGALSGILDETDLDLIGVIVAILENHRKPEWIDIHNLRVIKYGAALHIDCHVTLPWYLHIQEAHKEVTAIENLINEKMPNHVEFFIHTDPCETESCTVCTKTDCEVRQKPFVSRMKWNKDNISVNEKHHK